MFSCEYERCCSQSESSMIARSCFLPPQTGSRGRWSCCSSHPASPPLPSLSLFLWTSLCPTLCLLILKERGLVRLVHWTTSPECQIKWNPNKWALEKSGSFFGVFSLYWQDHTTVLSYFFYCLFIQYIQIYFMHSRRKWSPFLALLAVCILQFTAAEIALLILDFDASCIKGALGVRTKSFQ